MKNILTLTLLFVFVFVGVVQARTWTDVKGRHLEGKYAGISETDASKVKIQLASSGRVVSVSIQNLSPEDQNYVQAQQKAEIAAEDEGFDDDSPNPLEPQKIVQEPQNVDEPIQNDNPNNEIVVVEGIGDNIAEAKKDAMRNAVEQVVGALVDAQTRVENDELIEQILTASGAYIEKSEVLSAKKENGLVTIKLRATVVKMSLTKKLKLGGGGQTIAVDGSNLVDLASSKVDAEKSGAMFLANFLKKEEFPYSLLDTKVVGQPQITQKGNEVIYSLKVEASVNRERYMDFVKRIKPIFDKYAIQQSSFVLETYNKENHIFYDIRNVPIKKYNNNLPLYLCTEITGNFRSLKFDMYELPKKFSVPLRYYKHVAPVIEIVLLDNNNMVVATKRAILDNYHDSNNIELLNVMPSLLLPIPFKRSNAVGESTIIQSFNHNGRIESLGYCFAPYWRHNNIRTFDINFSQHYTFQIVLTPDELSKVRSAKIAVIVNNPEMDKAFKTMESEIEQIPTN